MILFCHLLVGAAIAVKIQILPLALIFAFLSHYVLDFIPHWEYSVDNIFKKQWKKAKFDFLKVVLDFGAGILLIVFINHISPICHIGYISPIKPVGLINPVLLACAFFAIIPDGLTLLSLLLPNKILSAHDKFHRDLVHYHKKISFRENKIFFVLGILTQILVSVIAIFFLVF